MNPVMPEGCSFLVRVNGAEKGVDFCVSAYDVVIFVIIPEDGGDLLKLVGMLAVVALSIAVPQLAPASWGLMVEGALTPLGMAVSGGIMIGGSMLLNAVLPPTMPDVTGSSGSLDESPTYGWTDVGNIDAEGTPLPYIVGSKRVKPPLINQYIETVDNKQYLYMLFALANGEIDVNINEVWLNNTALFNSEGIAQIEGVDVQARPGTPNQEAIPWFDITWTQQNVNYTLARSASNTVAVGETLQHGTYVFDYVEFDSSHYEVGAWTDIYETLSPTEHFNVHIECPDGLRKKVTRCHESPNAGLRCNSSIKNNNARICIQYRGKGTSEWTSVDKNVGPATTGKPFLGMPQYADGRWYLSKTFSIDNLEPNIYEVRVGMYSAPDQPVNFKSLNSFPMTAIKTTTGNNVTSLDAVIVFNALYYMNDKGNLKNETVKIAVEYCEHGTEDWTGEERAITRATQQPVRISFMFKDLPPAQYDVRAYYTTPPATSTRKQNQAVWSLLQEGVSTENFSYPGTALLGVKALATDQFSGSRPTVECRIASSLVDRSQDDLTDTIYFQDKTATLYTYGVDGSGTYSSVNTVFTTAFNPVFVIKGDFESALDTCTPTISILAYKDDNLICYKESIVLSTLTQASDTIDYTADLSSFTYASGKTISDALGEKIKWHIEFNSGDATYNAPYTIYISHILRYDYKNTPIGNPSVEAQYFLKHFGIPEENINQDSFDEWEDFCNAPPAEDYESTQTYSINETVSYNGLTYYATQNVPVSTPPTGVELANEYWARFTLSTNLYIDQGLSFRQALDQISLPGRGKIVQRGVMWDVMWEHETDRVDIVTSGNMIEKSFKETFLSSEDYANICEVTYFPDEAGRTIAELRAPDFDSSEQDKPASIVIYGVTNKIQALQHGTLVLNSTRLMTRVCSWEQSTDSIRWQVGDVVGVQSNQTPWTKGGRLVSATSTGCVIDRDDIGTLISPKIILRHTDGTIETQSISTITADAPVEGQSTVVLSGSWNTTPAQYDIYNIGPTEEVIKDFRISSISSASDVTREITAIEYNEDVYSADVVLPEEASSYSFPPVSNITLTETTKWNADGTMQLGIHARWDGVAAEGFRIYYGYGDNAWDAIFENRIGFVDTNDNSIFLPVSQVGDVLVAICSFDTQVNRNAYASNEIASITLTGDAIRLQPNASVFRVKHIDDPETEIAPFGTTMADGLATVGLNAPVEGIFVKSTDFGNEGAQLEYNDGSPRFYVGDGSDSYVRFEANTLTWRASNTQLDSSGNLIATSATLSGDVTATSGSFTGTINASDGIFSGYVTAGTARIGANVSGDNDGIRLDADNYWYTSGLKATSGEIAGFTLSASSISADSGNMVLDATTPKISLGNVSNFMSGTGLWMGKDADATYKVHIGDPLADHLYWDGATLYLTGEIIAASGSTIVGTVNSTFEINNDDSDVNASLILNKNSSLAYITWNGSALTLNKPLSITGNITVTGTVDGVDVAALKVDVDGFPDELKNLVTDEIQQLENIGSVTISNTQWGYVGSLNQGLAKTSNVDFNNISSAGDVTITGNLTVLGTEFIAQVDTVEIKDNLAIINSGETGAGVTAGFAGWLVDRGSLTDYKWGFDESINLFVVGTEGSTQAVATRQNTPTNAGIPFWNASVNRLDNSANATLDLSGNVYFAGDVGIGITSPSEKLHVVGNIKATGDFSIGTFLKGNATENRFEVWDVISEKVAMGYLDALPKNDGSGTWSASDYGFWVRQGDTLTIDGDVNYENGDWLIENDATVKIQNGANEVIWLGTRSGNKGLFLWNGGAEPVAWFRQDEAKIGGLTVNATKLTFGAIEIDSSNQWIRQTSNKWLLKNDGSGQLASGNITWDSTGNTSISATLDINNLSEVYSNLGIEEAIDEAKASVYDYTAFAPFKTWDTYNEIENLTFTNASHTEGDFYATVTGTAQKVSIESPSISINGALYNRIIMRVRTTSTSSLVGRLYYKTSAHDYSSDYYCESVTTGTGWVFLNWDMTTLISGGTDYIDNTITGIKIELVYADLLVSEKSTFDLGTEESFSLATDTDFYDFDFDWLSIGNSSNSTLVLNGIETAAIFGVMAPEGDGLFIDGTHLGYHEDSTWKTYMDSSGNFYLGGTSGKLQWNASTNTLTIDGTAITNKIQSSNWSSTSGSEAGMQILLETGKISVNEEDGIIVNSNASILLKAESTLIYPKIKLQSYYDHICSIAFEDYSSIVTYLKFTPITTTDYDMFRIEGFDSFDVVTSSGVALTSDDSAFIHGNNYAGMSNNDCALQLFGYAYMQYSVDIDSETTWIYRNNLYKDKSSITLHKNGMAYAAEYDIGYRVNASNQMELFGADIVIADGDLYVGTNKVATETVADSKDDAVKAWVTANFEPLA
jgi:hypothetical protein